MHGTIVRMVLFRQILGMISNLCFISKSSDLHRLLAEWFKPAKARHSLNDVHASAKLDLQI